MKFQYTPVDILIAEVAGQMSEWEQRDDFDYDNAYMYAIEAARLIGLNAYDDETCVIEIRNHVGFLPKVFYLCEEVWMLDKCDQATTNTIGYNDLFFIKKYMMHPGDSSTVKLCTPNQNPTIPSNIISYRLTKRQIRTSFNQGYVMMKYLHLPKNEEGVICIQDEINCIKAIKSYVLMELLKPGFMMEKVSNYVYQDIKNDWNVYYSQATAVQAMPDPKDAEWQVAKNQNRYNSFKL